MKSYSGAAKGSQHPGWKPTWEVAVKIAEACGGEIILIKRDGRQHISARATNYGPFQDEHPREGLSGVIDANAARDWDDSAYNAELLAD